MAMTLVSTVTVGAGTIYDMVVTGIPQNGKDLLVVFSSRNKTSTNGASYITINNRTADSQRFLIGNGSTVSSTNATNQSGTFLANGNTLATDTASTFSSVSIYIANYTSTQVKSLSVDGVTENNATAAFAYIGAASQTNANPVTSITVGQNAELAQNSTLSLYIIS